MGREFELKYAAEPAAQEAIAEKFGDFETIVMETTYYDTPDGDLSARHITLRRRTENGRSVCTLKTPADGLGRGEWEMDCPRITDALPSLARLSGCLELLELASRGLIAVCGAKFTRQALDLEFEEFSAELALDLGCLHSGSREIPLCEVELELKSGSREALEAFASRFAKVYHLEAEPKSKFARASALRQEERHGI